MSIAVFINSSTKHFLLNILIILSKIKKMKLFSLGECSWFLLFPIIAPLFTLLSFYILDIITDRLSAESVKTNYYGLMLFLIFLSMIMGGCLEWISIFRVKKNLNLEEQEQINNDSFSKESSKDSSIGINKVQIGMIKVKKKNKKQYVFLKVALCALLDYLGYVVLLIITKSNYFLELMNTEIIGIQLFFLVLFTRLILKNKIYLHEIVSITSIIIGMLIILISTFTSFPNYIDLDTCFFYKFFCLMLSPLSYSIGVVYEKKVMQTTEISPYKLLFYKGISGSILCFLANFVIQGSICPEGSSASAHILFCHSSQTWKEIGQVFLDGITILLILAIVISQFCYHFFYVLTNYYFSPCHTGASDMISSLSGWYALTLEFSKPEGPGGRTETQGLFHFLHAVGYIIIIMSILIYNEIIIFYVCGMEENTKIMIIQRGNRDASEAIEQNSFIEAMQFNRDSRTDSLTQNDSTSINENELY